MRAVNLASRPFLNRRPVIRVATLVWLLAIGLTAVNIWRYGDFFRTATSHRSRLADLEKEITAEQERNADLRKRIGALKLDEDNSTATYLNGLIHQRVFPWSRLFDDIEDLLPKDVYLIGLSPQIQKVEKTKVRPTTRAASARARAGRAPQPRPAKIVPEKDIDRVAMAIQGYSRSDEAMLELVDRLYASPTFLDPVLSSERLDPKTGLVDFRIEVIYLTRARLAEAGAGTLLAQAGAGAPAGEVGSGVAGETAGGGEAGTLAEDVRAVGPAGRNGAGGARPGALSGFDGQPGFTAPGTPVPGDGRPATRPGFDAGAGGTATGAGGRRQGAGGPRDPMVIQPGFSNPDLRGQPAGGETPGGVVVPPRRPPGSLLPAPSATPGLRGGG